MRISTAAAASITQPARATRSQRTEGAPDLLHSRSRRVETIPNPAPSLLACKSAYVNRKRKPGLSWPRGHPHGSRDRDRPAGPAGGGVSGAPPHFRPPGACSSFLDPHSILLPPKLSDKPAASSMPVRTSLGPVPESRLHHCRRVAAWTKQARQRTLRAGSAALAATHQPGAGSPFPACVAGCVSVMRCSQPGPPGSP